MASSASFPYHVQAYKEYAYRESYACFLFEGHAIRFAEALKKQMGNEYTISVIDYSQLKWKVLLKL